MTWCFACSYALSFDVCVQCVLLCVPSSISECQHTWSQGMSLIDDWLCFLQGIVLIACVCLAVSSLHATCIEDTFAWRTQWWQWCFIWPVLKHGPRSLTHVRVHGWPTYDAKWKWQMGCLHQQPTNQLREVWVWASVLGPERWWTMPEKGKLRGNSDGGLQRYWRANRSSYLGIGAKD